MCVFTETNSMASPLLLAIRNGESSTAKSILLNGQFSDLEKQNSKRDGTALFLACCKGMAEMVHMLILHGADTETPTSYGATALHAAVDHNQLEIARLLINYGADVNAVTKRGDTPCHFAAYRGYAPIVQLLAESGADVTIVNTKSQSPTRLAAAGDNHTIAKYLQAVANLAKHRPTQYTTRKPRPLIFQRSVSGESINSTVQETKICLGCHSGRYSSVYCDSVDDKISNITDSSSMISVNNIAGSHLTELQKQKQYSKNLSWDG